MLSSNTSTCSTISLIMQSFGGPRTRDPSLKPQTGNGPLLGQTNPDLVAPAPKLILRDPLTQKYSIRARLPSQTSTTRDCSWSTRCSCETPTTPTMRKPSSHRRRWPSFPQASRMGRPRVCRVRHGELLRVPHGRATAMMIIIVRHGVCCGQAPGDTS